MNLKRFLEGETEMEGSRLKAFYDAFEHAEHALGRSTGHGIAIRPRGNDGIAVEFVRVTGREEPPFVKTLVVKKKQDVFQKVRELGGTIHDPAPLVFLEEVGRKRWVLVDAETLQPRKDTQLGGIAQEFEAA